MIATLPKDGERAGAVSSMSRLERSDQTGTVHSDELAELLTPGKHDSARASTPNAHFTSLIVITRA
jgi:hypothetical protein